MRWLLLFLATLWWLPRAEATSTAPALADYPELVAELSAHNAPCHPGFLSGVLVRQNPWSTFDPEGLDAALMPGMVFQGGQWSYDSSANPFARGGADGVASLVTHTAKGIFNVQEVREGFELMYGANYKTAQGWAEGLLGAVSTIANTVDALSNFIPGKGAVEGAAKTGVKTLTKDAAEVEGKKILATAVEDAAKIETETAKTLATDTKKAVSEEGKKYHGNDRRNTDPQHNYDILDKDGRVQKNGVGTGAAVDDVSKRAESQLKEGDTYRITDRHEGGEGARGQAYDREKERSREHLEADEPMTRHKRPK